MKVTGLDGREYPLSLSTTKRKKVSDLHARARKLLKTLFAFDIIYEEVTMVGTKTGKNGTLYLDFFLPARALCVEVQGSQHSEYNPFFYANQLEFNQAKARDSVKQQWCDLNGFDLVELPYNESDDEWRKRIESR
jgi:hypothetical protein